MVFGFNPLCNSILQVQKKFQKNLKIENETAPITDFPSPSTLNAHHQKNRPFDGAPFTGKTAAMFGHTKFKWMFKSHPLHRMYYFPRSPPRVLPMHIKKAPEESPRQWCVRDWSRMAETLGYVYESLATKLEKPIIEVLQHQKKRLLQRLK